MIASGGNAGLAAAHAASILRVRCSVFIPETVDKMIVKHLEHLGANVVIGGRDYSDALRKAEEAVKGDDNAYSSLISCSKNQGHEPVGSLQGNGTGIR